MNNGKICVSVCARTVDELRRRAAAATQTADLVELRLDCLSDAEFDRLPLDQFEKHILTLRPREQGGFRDLTLQERTTFWSTVRGKFGVDLEEDTAYLATTDFDPKICSFHDFSESGINLSEIFGRLTETPDAIIKIAVNVSDAAEAIDVWKLLQTARSESKQIIPVAMGEAGKWTRILGLAHGAYLTYAAPDKGDRTAPGQITVADMLDVFRVKELDRQTAVYGIIAGDTSYSMSPFIHNAAFKAAGRNAVFVPFQVRDLNQFVRRMVRPECREVELNFHGFSVTNPYKRSIVKHLDGLDETARSIGAVNTIKIVNGEFQGLNTDADGFIGPLKRAFGDLRSANVALVGAGGAARACAYPLKREGAKVTVLARDPVKADDLAAAFGLTTGNWELKTGFETFDIVVNATPLGTKGDLIRESIATRDQLSGVKLVYDLVYNPAETRLLREAKAAGAKTISGFDMLLAQAVEQQKIWTDETPDIEAMRAAAQKRLDKN
jgi:3-dehydroquinate dehydratase/shikimate dehydrogenase